MTEGGILAFLPGEAEIRATEKLLEEKLPNAAIIMPLYGSLPFEQQNKILEPLKDETFRKVVLSTSIAETSLTIEGNSLLKAQTIYDKYKMNCLSDDTGLEVDF